MTKFTYRLDGVLGIKMKLEKQAEMEFAAAKMKLNAEEAKLEDCIRKLEESEALLKTMMLDSLDVKKIRQQHSAVEYAGERAEKQQMAVKRAGKQVDLAAAKLNMLMQERKSMEKLREKEFEEYKKEYNAEMSKEVDELVSYKAVAGDTI